MATPVREGWGGRGRGDRALVVGFLLQEFLLSRPWWRKLQQAGGLQDGDATVPPGGVLAGGSRGEGWATSLVGGLVHLSAVLPNWLRLCGTGSVPIIVPRVFRPWDQSVT